jgi:hypothetical protein
MTRGDRPDYDSFMIRIWHGAGGDRLLRAEVDHIQTGAVYVGREVSADWIEQTVRDSIRRHADGALNERATRQQENDDA